MKFNRIVLPETSFQTEHLEQLVPATNLFQKN